MPASETPASETPASATKPASASASASASGGVVDLLEMLTQVKKTVDEKIAAFSSGFFRDSREATSDIADRLDYVKDALASSCDETTAKDDDVAHGVTIPRRHADLLDRMRSRTPAAYEALRSRASALVLAKPLETRNVLRATLADLAALSKQ